MTAPLPSLSVQQLTEQLEELLARPGVDLPWSRNDSRTYDANGLHVADYNDGDDAAVSIAAVSNLPTLLATIRRLQATCDAKQAVIDAVTELADKMNALACRAADKSDDFPFEYGIQITAELAERKLRAALASSDTAQEAGAS